MGREGRGLGEQRHSHCGIFRLEDYIFNNHNFFLKANGNVSLQLRGRETQRREGRKPRGQLAPQDWSQAQGFVLVDSRKEEAGSHWELGAVS